MGNKNYDSVTNFILLCVMMFVQFFVWGSWYVSVTGFLTAEKMFPLVGAVYTVGPIAAIIAPFFLGMIADRFFSTEKVLGVLHILGGLFLIGAPHFASEFTLGEMPENASLFYKVVMHDLQAYVHPFTLMLFGHMLCYMPTLGLTTSLAFSHLSNQEQQFPIVRVLGTIGWIAGNIAISILPNTDASIEQFYMAGGAGIALGIFSFFLPNTPPPSKGQEASVAKILGFDAYKLFATPAFLVFIICSFLLCIPLAGYYAFARTYVEWSGALVNNSATFTMSFGQMSEIIFMLLMPFFFVRLGVKNMLAIGMLAWVARYVLFAFGADDKVFWMVLAGVILHGICYDFFFVSGMIYVDKKAPKSIRGQAQGLLVLITQGLGLGIGAKLSTAHVMMNQTGTGEATVTDWYQVWLTPALFAGGVLVVFYLLFWDKVSPSEEEVAVDAAQDMTGV
jgi:nucleoside transporter